MSEPDRYYLFEVGGARNSSLSVSVLDRYVIHREMARFSVNAGRPAKVVRLLAVAECERLNKLEREDDAT